MARRGKTIDFKTWFGMPSLRQSFSTDGTRLASGSLAFSSTSTILRVRTPEIMAFLDNTQQAGDIIDLTFGLGIFSTDAVTAGAGSMPDPQVEADYPWLWWGSIHLEGDAAASFQGLGTSVVWIHPDTKAMRRVRAGQSLTWVVEAGQASGAPTTILFVGQSRVLIGT